jgi:hypothetical protein
VLARAFMASAASRVQEQQQLQKQQEQLRKDMSVQGAAGS